MKIHVLSAVGLDADDRSPKSLVSDFAFKSAESAQNYIPKWKEILIGNDDSDAEFDEDVVHGFPGLRIGVREIDLFD